MIDLKIECDKCGKTELLLPLDYSKSIAAEVESTEFVIHKSGPQGAIDNEYCKVCYRDLHLNKMLPE